MFKEGDHVLYLNYFVCTVKCLSGINSHGRQIYVIRQDDNKKLWSAFEEDLALIKGEDK